MQGARQIVAQDRDFRSQQGQLVARNGERLGNPVLYIAAQVYAASLLSIEVDTPAERQYLQQLADGMGLSPEVTSRLEKTVGI